MKTHLTAALAALSLLSACAQPGQSRYGYQDVGKATPVEFGTVIALRDIEITGQNTGIGATAGIAGGALAGAQIGHGDGSLAGLIAGALIAGLAGHAIEQAVADHRGVEYTVRLVSGRTLTVAQNANPEDPVLGKGMQVMVQTTGEHMRVLPATDEPKLHERQRRAK